MGMDLVAREMHALRRAPISALIIFVVAIGLGFGVGRMVYKDQADHWRNAYLESVKPQEHAIRQRLKASRARFGGRNASLSQNTA
jgi:hypothetical protein